MKNFLKKLLDSWDKIPDSIQIVIYVTLAELGQRLVVDLANIQTPNDYVKILIDFSIVPVINVILFQLKQLTANRVQ